MEHALREYARSGFGRALGVGAAARNCERSVYNWAVQETRKVRDDPSWENKVFRWRYKQKVYGLLKELERSPVAATDLQVVGDAVKLEIHITSQLARRLQLKELDTKNLARYSADVLWPGGPYAKKAFDIKSKDLAMEAAKAKEDDYNGLFKCGKCKGVKTTYYQMQTRSADEPMVRLLLFFRSALVLMNFPTDNLRHVQDLWEPMEMLKSTALF
jgi:DNA-directed RNA polymerase subunit M/transcription elongation factor TFIIS